MPKVKAVQSYSELQPNKCYLVLISPGKMPHIALINKGAYYSLTYKKCIAGEHFASYLSFFKRTKRALLFLELSHLVQDPALIFKRYKCVDTEKITCLTPIKETVLKESKANFVFELIPELYEANRIVGAFQLNMDELLDDLGDFNLVEYSKSAIFDYIKTLNQKYVKGQ